MNKIQFECALQDPKAVYKSGDYVTGTILVEFSEITKIRGIDVRLLGQANVQWTESKRSANDSRRIITKNFRNKETYFDVTIVLFGRADNEPGDNKDHPLGPHRYPFRFQLPPGLPATFEGTNGSVTYAIYGQVDIPWAPDRTFKQRFKVTADLDLNEVPPARDPLVGRDEKVLCCMCCKHGPIVAEFSVPQAGFVPGEKILVNALVTNQSRRKILRTEVKLKQTILYRSSTSKSKLVSKEMLSLVDEEDILKGGHFQWEKEPILVPPCPPSFLPYCSIIDIRYELVFNIDVAGTTIDMEMPLEIIIGTIPLKDSKAKASLVPSMAPRVGSRKESVVTRQPSRLESPIAQSPNTETTVAQTPNIETTNASRPESAVNSGTSLSLKESGSHATLPEAVT